MAQPGTEEVHRTCVRARSPIAAAPQWAVRTTRGWSWPVAAAALVASAVAVAAAQAALGSISPATPVWMAPPPRTATKVRAVAAPAAVQEVAAPRLLGRLAPVAPEAFVVEAAAPVTSAAEAAPRGMS